MTIPEADGEAANERPVVKKKKSTGKPKKKISKVKTAAAASNHSNSNDDRGAAASSPANVNASTGAGGATPVVKKKKKKKKSVTAEGDNAASATPNAPATAAATPKKKKLKKPKPPPKEDSDNDDDDLQFTIHTDVKLDSTKSLDSSAKKNKNEQQAQTPTKPRSKKLKKKAGGAKSEMNVMASNSNSANNGSGHKRQWQSQRMTTAPPPPPGSQRMTPPPPPGTRRRASNASNSGHSRPSSLLNMNIFTSSHHKQKDKDGGADNQDKPKSLRAGRRPSNGSGRAGPRSMWNLGGSSNKNLPEQPPNPKQRPPSILRNSMHMNRRGSGDAGGDGNGGAASPTNSGGSQSSRINPDGSITTTPTNGAIFTGGPIGNNSTRSRPQINSSSHHLPPPPGSSGTSSRYMSRSIRRTASKDPPRPGLMAGIAGLDMSSHHVRNSPEGAKVLDLSNHSKDDIYNSSDHGNGRGQLTRMNSSKSMRSTMSHDLQFEEDPTWKQALRYIRILPPHRDEKPIKRKIRIMIWLALLCDITAAIVSIATYGGVTECCGRPILNIASDGINWNTAIRIATYVYIAFIFLEIVPVVREGVPFNLLNPLIGFTITFAVFFDDRILEAAIMWIIEATAVVLEVLTYRCHLQLFQQRKNRLKAVGMDLQPFQEHRRRKREISRRNIRRSQKIMNGEALSSSDESGSDSDDTDDSFGNDEEYTTINDIEKNSMTGKPLSKRSAFQRKLSKGDMSALSTGSGSMHEGNFRDEDASGSDKELTQVRELTLLRERRILRQRQGQETKTLRYHLVGACINVSLSVITFLLIVFIARSGGLCIRDFRPPNIFAVEQFSDSRCNRCKDTGIEVCEICDGDSVQCFYPYTLQS